MGESIELENARNSREPHEKKRPLFSGPSWRAFAPFLKHSEEEKEKYCVYLIQRKNRAKTTHCPCRWENVLMSQ